MGKEGETWGTENDFKPELDHYFKTVLLIFDLKKSHLEKVAFCILGIWLGD